jgi:hypothetical protein
MIAARGKRVSFFMTRFFVLVEKDGSSGATAVSQTRNWNMGTLAGIGLQKWGPLNRGY